MIIKFTAIIILSFILIGIGQGNIYGQNTDDNLPIPKFNTPKQQIIADELREAYRKMKQHLCDKSSENWEAQFKILLGELVVAQHRTMWAAAGYIQLVAYTPSLQPFYVKKDAIRDLLTKAAQRNPANATEIQRIVDRLNENSRRFAEAANSKGYGHSIFVVYANGAVLSELDKELNRSNLRRFGISEADYTTLRNQAMKALTDTVRLIYSYAVNEINKKIPSTAPPFAVYTSNDYQYFIPILKSLSYTIPITFDLAKLDSMQDEWHTYAKTKFNEADLKGNCQKEIVRILFVPSRRADAEKAAKTLKDNNFEAELRPVLENAVPTHKGKIYYQNKGNYERANIISGLVRNIENVSPDNSTGESSDSPDYSLWLMGKKEIQPRGKIVRIVYTENRLADVNKAAQLLKENGFRIELYKVNSPFSDSLRHKLFINLSIGGTEKEGQEIAEIVKNIEKLIPSASTTITAKEVEQYFLWIVR